MLNFFLIVLCFSFNGLFEVDLVGLVLGVGIGVFKGSLSDFEVNIILIVLVGMVDVGDVGVCVLGSICVIVFWIVNVDSFLVGGMIFGVFLLMIVVLIIMLVVVVLVVMVNVFWVVSNLG